MLAGTPKVIMTVKKMKGYLTVEKCIECNSAITWSSSLAKVESFEVKKEILCKSQFSQLNIWEDSGCLEGQCFFYFQADNVTDILMKVMAPGVLTNKEDFLGAVEKDVNFKPFGDLLHSYKVHKGQCAGWILSKLAGASIPVNHIGLVGASIPVSNIGLVSWCFEPSQPHRVS